MTKPKSKEPYHIEYWSTLCIRGFRSPPRWFWHLIAHNGNILCDSGEHYSSKGNCLRAIRLVQAAMRGELPVRKRE